MYPGWPRYRWGGYVDLTGHGDITPPPGENDQVGGRGQVQSAGHSFRVWTWQPLNHEITRGHAARQTPHVWRFLGSRLPKICREISQYFPIFSQYFLNIWMCLPSEFCIWNILKSPVVIRRDRPVMSEAFQGSLLPKICCEISQYFPIFSQYFPNIFWKTESGCQVSFVDETS